MKLLVSTLPARIHRKTTTVLGSSKVGGRRVSSSLGHGVVEPKSTLLRTVLGFAAIGSGFSIGPDAKSTDLQISTPTS